jgi:hypothetical protein
MDIIKASNATTHAKITFFPLQEIDIILDIPNNVIDESASKWNQCLVGFFPGYKMPYHATNFLAFRVWKNYGLESVMTT